MEPRRNQVIKKVKWTFLIWISDGVTRRERNCIIESVEAGQLSRGRWDKVAFVHRTKR